MKIRNKNAILELLQDGVDFEQVYVARELKPDEQTRKIIELAGNRRIPILDIPRKQMAVRRSGETREAIFAVLGAPKLYSLDALFKQVYARGQEPLFLLINRVRFASNIGLIARTAYAAGVNGIIFQGDISDYYNEDTVHFSLGAIARLPLVKMNIFQALKDLSDSGIKTYCIQMGGTTYYEQDMTGPAAFVLGAERAGASDTISDKCDYKLAIPMQEGIDSLNVGAAMAVVLYEKLRQDKL